MKCRTILLFQPMLESPGLHMCEGVHAYARKAGWRVHMVEYGQAASERFLTGGDRLLPDLDMLNRIWHPDGCIVMGGNGTMRKWMRGFGHAPVVFLDPQFEIDDGGLFVTCDNEAVVKAAFDELSAMGVPCMAYVSYPLRQVWDGQRRRVFSELCAEKGLAFRHCRWRSPPSLENLCKFLKAMPKPCGILAANDIVANAVVSACSLVGIDIPRQVAVIGADDNEQICENAIVSLSSVRMDWRQAGHMAAALLGEWMSCGALQGNEVRKLMTASVVRRASTRKTMISDARVDRALEFIRRHACSGIGVKDVVSEMRCSRRYADLRFREITGHSILAEIRRMKIDEARQKLCGTGKSLLTVAQECGFSSDVDFRRVFRMVMGVSPRDWRNQVTA